MTKAHLTLLAIASLLMTVDHSQAGLGWSFDECVQHYGQTTEPNSRTQSGRILCVFSARGYEIDAFFMANWVSRIAYISPTGFDMAGVENFLATNGPGATWTGPNKDDADGSYRWDGLKNGASAYTASLSSEGRTLLIWTKEDDEFGSTHNAQEANGL
jgi:hypothetical protein